MHLQVHKGRGVILGPSNDQLIGVRKWAMGIIGVGWSSVGEVVSILDVHSQGVFRSCGSNVPLWLG